MARGVAGPAPGRKARGASQSAAGCMQEGWSLRPLGLCGPSQGSRVPRVARLACPGVLPETHGCKDRSRGTP